MGNIGMPELIMILVLALLLFGPQKLPEIGKQVGKALGEFKRTSNELKRTIEDEMDRATKETPPSEPPPSPPPSGTVTAPTAAAAPAETGETATTKPS
ncbi:MAG: twin-arginine translocase TatA/TatE family subunit [Thermoanaerobaculia bacterium]